MRKSILFFVFAFTCNFAMARIIYVNKTAVGSINGNSWTNAYTSFQSALDSAVWGDTIWVAKGTYKPSKSYNLPDSVRYYHFRMLEGVAIYGGFAGTEDSLNQRDLTANETILSGDVNGDDIISGSGKTLSITNNEDNNYHVFYHPLDYELTDRATLNNFTISGGNANGIDLMSNANNPIIMSYGGAFVSMKNSPQIQFCKIIANSSKNAGGAINTRFGSNFFLVDCSISQNKSAFGGAICNSDGAWPAFLRCVLAGNKSDSAGGAAYSNQSSVYYDLCRFSENYAPEGAAIFNYNSNMVLEYSFLNANIASKTGGAVKNEYFSTSALKDDTISNNSSENGGAIYNGYKCLLFLTNCIINDNKSTNCGGGIYADNSSPILRNCTICANQAGVSGGGLYNDSVSIPELYNTIIFYNSSINGKQIYKHGNNLVPLNHCCYSNNVGDIFGGLIANNCINADPLFVDAINSDYRIYGNSPCVDAGDSSQNSEQYDIRWNNVGRKLDKTSGGIGQIDIGAFEYKIGFDYANSSVLVQDDFDNYNINISPNPTGSEIKVSTQLVDGDYSIELFNDLGVLVAILDKGFCSELEYSRTFNISNIASGSYRLIIRNDKQISFKTISIVK